MSDDVPPSSEELDVVFTQGKNGKLVFARDAEGNFFLDSRGVYKKAVQQLIDSQRDHTDTHDVSYLEQRLHLQPGAIASQQRGERNPQAPPITMDYGDGTSTSAYSPGKQPGSAVFIIDIASKSE
jgi:hypothetical protein